MANVEEDLIHCVMCMDRSCRRCNEIANRYGLLALNPSPGVTSEKVGRCEKCGSTDPGEKWCMYKSHTAKGNFTRVNPSNPFCVECDNKSFHNPVSRPKTCPDCGSSDPKVRLTSRPINRVFDLGYVECDNEAFHGSLPDRPENEPARGYDFHGNPPNLPACPELDKDEGGQK